MRLGEGIDWTVPAPPEPEPDDPQATRIAELAEEVRQLRAHIDSPRPPRSRRVERDSDGLLVRLIEEGD